MTINVYRVKENGELMKSYKSYIRVESIKDLGEEIEIKTYFDTFRLTKDDHHIELFI